MPAALTSYFFYLSLWLSVFKGLVSTVTLCVWYTLPQWAAPCSCRGSYCSTEWQHNDISAQLIRLALFLPREWYSFEIQTDISDQRGDIASDLLWTERQKSLDSRKVHKLQLGVGHFPWKCVLRIYPCASTYSNQVYAKTHIWCLNEGTKCHACLNSSSYLIFDLIYFFILY